MAYGTPLTFYILNLSSNKYANYHRLKHAGLGSLLYWCRSNLNMFFEALMSLSMQHNLHSLFLQRITLRILDSLASGSKTPFFFQRIRFRYNTTGLRHKEHVWLVMYSSLYVCAYSFSIRILLFIYFLRAFLMSRLPFTLASFSLNSLAGMFSS